MVTERSFGAAPSERLVRWEARARRLGEGSEPSRESWEEWLGEHATSPIEGSCVHWEERGYGTRSSFLLRAGRDGIWAGFREGPACGGELQAIGAELAPLAQGWLPAPIVER